MTLARTALRLCVTAALKGADVTPAAPPTIAGRRIYDSRVDDLNPESYSEDARPTIIVLTDSDEGEALSRQNGGAPFHRLIELVIEFGMVVGITDAGTFVVGYPDTDKRLEASLDYLEFQIMRCLSYDPMPIPTLFRKFVRIRTHECHRQVLDDTGGKIAARLLTLTCEVNDDQVIVCNATAAQPTGLDVLPEPLRSVAKAMPQGSAEADVVTALAAALQPVTVPQLRSLDITADPDPGHRAPTVRQKLNFPPSS